MNNLDISHDNKIVNIQDYETAEAIGFIEGTEQNSWIPDVITGTPIESKNNGFLTVDKNGFLPVPRGAKGFQLTDKNAVSLIKNGNEINLINLPDGQIGFAKDTTGNGYSLDSNGQIIQTANGLKLIDNGFLPSFNSRGFVATLNSDKKALPDLINNSTLEVAPFTNDPNLLIRYNKPYIIETGNGRPISYFPDCKNTNIRIESDYNVDSFYKYLFIFEKIESSVDSPYIHYNDKLIIKTFDDQCDNIRYFKTEKEKLSWFEKLLLRNFTGGFKSKPMLTLQRNDASIYTCIGEKTTPVTLSRIIDIFDEKIGLYAFNYLFETGIKVKERDNRFKQKEDEARKKEKIETFEIERKIPLNLFQVWIGNEMPIKMKNLTEKIKSENPEFKYKCYNDKDSIDFLRENFSSEVIDAYYTLIPGSYKADLMRFALLYKFGGVYIDTKMEPVNGFKFITLTDKNYYLRDNFIKFTSSFTGTEENVSTQIIVSEPNTDILKNCIDQLVMNVKNRFYGVHTTEVTGPGLLHKSLFEHQIMSESLELSVEHTIPPYCVEYKNKPILKVNTNVYDEQVSNGIKSKNHGTLWFEKQIYKD